MVTPQVCLRPAAAAPDLRVGEDHHAAHGAYPGQGKVAQTSVTVAGL